MNKKTLVFSSISVFVLAAGFVGAYSLLPLPRKDEPAEVVVPEKVEPSYSITIAVREKGYILSATGDGELVIEDKSDLPEEYKRLLSKRPESKTIIQLRPNFDYRRLLETRSILEGAGAKNIAIEELSNR